jgi:hypothetical protein
MTESLAHELFDQKLNNARWVSVEVTELDRFRCTAIPGGGLHSGVRHRNLNLDLRGTFDRAAILDSIDAVFAQFAVIPDETEAAWGERLFIALKKHIPILESATVDLGCHRCLWLA